MKSQRKETKMIAHPRRFPNLKLGAAAVAAGLMLASCTPQYSAPQQLQTSNPSVTYKYRSDQELAQANQSAAIFCNRYQSVPRTASFATDPDGSRIVVYECVQTSASAAPPQSNPNLTYTYRTDQELLNASRNARIYCENNGSQQVTSNIVTNANGTKTVVFRCGPR
jgi:hypothetical protein